MTLLFVVLIVAVAYGLWSKWMWDERPWEKDK
jgi:ammonia channel protein AmtB